METYDTLQEEVTAQTTVIGGAVTLMNGLKTKLDAAIAANAAGDPTKLQALSDSLGANTKQLADAVAANTPAA